MFGVRPFPGAGRFKDEAQAAAQSEIQVGNRGDDGSNSGERKREVPESKPGCKARYARGRMEGIVELLVQRRRGVEVAGNVAKVKVVHLTCVQTRGQESPIAITFGFNDRAPP
jgi:hypothetical protein